MDYSNILVAKNRLRNILEPARGRKEAGASPLRPGPFSTSGASNGSKILEDLRKTFFNKFLYVYLKKDMVSF